VHKKLTATKPNSSAEEQTKESSNDLPVAVQAKKLSHGSLAAATFGHKKILNFS
jgi:hypothetical protein